MIDLNKIYQGHTLEILKTFPDEFVDTCPSSPPYWGLRDYGTPPVLWPEITFRLNEYTEPITVPEQKVSLGLEKSPVEFVAHTVAIYREVRRVLKSSGTAWVNFGDSYASQGKNRTSEQGALNSTLQGSKTNQQQILRQINKVSSGIKQKDLLGIPWMVAFALRADGWYLRSDIIWNKPNHMPESVNDRPTKAHEYIFLLSKNAKYFYDMEAVKEAVSESTLNDKRFYNSDFSNKRPNRNYPGQNSQGGGMIYTELTKNKRTVWTIPPKGYADAHFATFPEEIPSICIQAGSSEYGCCIECGMPYERIVEKELLPTHKAAKTFVIDERDKHADKQDQGSNRAKDGHKSGYAYASKTTGWKKTCKCETNLLKPSVVLDPFSGSGTTFVIGRKLQRDAVAIELNKDYIKLSDKRKHKSLGLFNT